MDREPIAAPFRDSRDAALYCLSVVLVLLLPLGLRAFHAPSHRTRMATAPTSVGEYTFIQHEVFDETSDLDVVFAGDSLMLNGIDTVEVQKALSEALGRPARVITLGWYWSGEDILYYVLRDLLAHRKVSHVVLRLQSEQTRPSSSHPQAYRWLFGCEHDRVIPTLGLKDWLQAYGIEAIGGPRNLVSLVRPDLLMPAWSAPTLGHMVVMRQLSGPFRPEDVPVPRFSLDTLMVDATNRLQRLDPVGAPSGGFQHQYAVGVRDLLRDRGIPVTLIRVPARTEARAHTLPVLDEQLSLYGDGTRLVVPDPGQLFAQVSDSELDGFYYYDQAHLNGNGSRYFTLAVMPALVEIQRGLRGH